MQDHSWIRYLKKIKPYNIQKGLRYLKHYGPREFWVRLCERMEPEEVPYGPWFEKHRPALEELEHQRKKKWKNPPLISVAVPAYRTPPVFLEEMIRSLQEQTYPYWELCIANASPGEEGMTEVLSRYAREDSRIRVKELPENLGIAENTNQAFAMASGEFAGLLDHDDLLAPQALYRVAQAILEEGADVVYTDEDKVTTDLSEHFQPHFKPDFNLDLLRSNNYITHFFVVRRTLVERVGGFRKEFDGAQDYDFIFRCVEASRKTVHIPEILYHWRTHKASTADNPASKMYAFEAGRRAIQAHLARSGVKGTVSSTKDLGFYRVEYPVQGEPLISVLIPNRDQKETLEKCLNSIWDKTTYSNYEILVVENNSTSEEIFRYYREIEKRPNVRVITWKGEFNYSAINNFGEKSAAGRIPAVSQQRRGGDQSPLDGGAAGQLPAQGSGDRGGQALLSRRHHPARGNRHRHRRHRRTRLPQHAPVPDRISAQGVPADGSFRGDGGLHDDEAFRCSGSWAALRSGWPWPSTMWTSACAPCRPGIWWCTTRQWSCTITNPNPGERRTARRRSAASRTEIEFMR